MSTVEPILVIGMHRAGTSMIADLLCDLGVFMGRRKDIYGEALFFQGLNDWLLRQSGGAWDFPEPVRHLEAHAQARSLVADYLRYMMRTPRVANYLGWRQYLRHRTPENLDVPWGWKDPCNTFTLPFWLDIFPQARVIHIYRHGVDVANSLKRRVDRRLAGAPALHDRRKRLLLYWLVPKRGGFADTMRCTTLEGGFSLWETYLRRAREQVERLGPRATELRYEDFLAEPRQGLASLARFCGLPASDAEVAAAAAAVKPGRAFAYRQNPELCTFAGGVADRLAEWGY